jgi:uncharacterized protein YyaL (SSP411 family)
LNTHFASPTGGFHLASLPHPPDLNGGHSASEEEKLPVPSLKPGTDNAVPSPNGIIASNLLLLSSYLHEPSYTILAKKTIDAFAIEIIQHPFLFVSMLSAVVLEAVGVKSVIAIGYGKLDHLTGFGRTVVWLEGDQRQPWLRQRNELLRDLRAREDGQARLLLCEAGGCRELKERELESRSEQQEGSSNSG